VSRWLTGSVVMGLAIAGCITSAWAAMRLSAVCHYSPLLVSVSVLIAVIASLAAIVFTFDYREGFPGNRVVEAPECRSDGWRHLSDALHRHDVGELRSFQCAPESFSRGGHFLSRASAESPSVRWWSRGVTILTIVDGPARLQFGGHKTANQRPLPSDCRTPCGMSSFLPNQISVRFCSSIAPTKRSGAVRSKAYTADPKSWLEGVHPEDREPSSGSCATSDRRTAHRKSRIQSGSGRRAPSPGLDCEPIPFLTTRAHWYRVVGSIHEFTKRKQAEDAHQQNRGQYRTVAETAT